MNIVIESIGILNFFCLICMVTIGLPHGAFDGVIASAMARGGSRFFLFKFIIIYIGISCFVVFIWILFPALSLISFLTISILHFGLGDSSEAGGLKKWFQVISHGGIIVVVISQFHKTEVDALFSYLVEGRTEVVWAVVNFYSAIILASTLVYVFCILKDRKDIYKLLELILLTILLLTLPPLLGFSIYFCLVHSPRHFYSVWHKIKVCQSQKVIFLQAILFTLGSWVAGGLIFYFYSGWVPAHIAFIKVIFIGLAALTVPHMILVDLFFRRSEFQKDLVR